MTTFIITIDHDCQLEINLRGENSEDTVDKGHEMIPKPYKP